MSDDFPDLMGLGTGVNTRSAYRIPIPDVRAYQPSNFEVALANRLGGSDPNMLVGYRLGAYGDRIAAQADYSEWLGEAMRRQQRIAEMMDATERRGQDTAVTRTALQHPTFASLFNLSRAQITPDGIGQMDALPPIEQRQREANVENTLAQAAQRRAEAARDRATGLTAAQAFAAQQRLLTLETNLVNQERQIANNLARQGVRVVNDASGRPLMEQIDTRTLTPEQRQAVEAARAEIAAIRRNIAEQRAALDRIMGIQRPDVPPPNVQNVEPMQAPASPPASPPITEGAAQPPTTQGAGDALATARALTYLPPGTGVTVGMIQRYVANNPRLIGYSIEGFTPDRTAIIFRRGNDTVIVPLADIARGR
jgi:hypothetical protein